MSGGTWNDDEDDDDFWYWVDDPPPPCPKPSTQELLELEGRAGNAYTKLGRCPPPGLRSSIRCLIEDVGIASSFVVNAIERSVPVESQLGRFENRVSRRWYLIHRKPRARPAETSRLWKRASLQRARTPNC